MEARIPLFLAVTASLLITSSLYYEILSFSALVSVVLLSAMLFKILSHKLNNLVTIFWSELTALYAIFANNVNNDL